MSIENHSGSKYIRTIYDCVTGEAIKVDVYAVLEAFNVNCPAIQHALKKLLCTGVRGKADKTTDLSEAKDSVSRAIEMEINRTKKPYTVTEESPRTTSVSIPDGIPARTKFSLDELVDYYPSRNDDPDFKQKGRIVAIDDYRNCYDIVLYSTNRTIKGVKENFLEASCV